jgi:hypothetical protein
VNAIHITLNVGVVTGDVIISQARCRAAGPDVLTGPPPKGGGPGGPGSPGGPGGPGGPRGPGGPGGPAGPAAPASPVSGAPRLTG